MNADGFPGKIEAEPAAQRGIPEDIRLYFCPKCRSVSAHEDYCPQCDLLRDSQAETYVEKLLETIFSPDPTRVGMAIDVLTKWMHEPRATIPLLLLLQSDVDTHRLVMAARGLGWQGDCAGIPALCQLLLDTTKPFIARVTAAQALGALGGKRAEKALQLAASDELTSVAQAAKTALHELANAKMICLE